MPDNTERKSAAAQTREEARQAFAEVYHEHRRRVFGLCYRLLGSREAAEDASSEIFLRLHKALSDYDPARPIASWIMAITSNYCIDVLRRRRREQQVFVQENPAMPVIAQERSPLALVADRENRERVRRAVSQLPEHYRVPLVLRYFAELSYDEIAEQTGLTKSYVATLLFRAKDEMRRLLEAEQ
jgi:RNA polymerase sigma-70 factor (ECF subfamily)